VVVTPGVIPALIDADTFARAGAALARGRGRTAPGSRRYLFTHLLVCGGCGAYMRGQPDHGRKVYICSSYKEYGTKACGRHTVHERALWGAVLDTLKDDLLSPQRLDAVEAEVAQRLETERGSGEAERLRADEERLARDIAQGHANLARLPADLLPGVIGQVRAWEGQRAEVLARLHELEHGAEASKAVLDEARRQLRRLREALAGDDEEAQNAVVREVVSKVEVRFTRPEGSRKSRPDEVLLYVRPGLGLSHLFTSDCRG
jgi:hypothetical protein